MVCLNQPIMVNTVSVVTQDSLVKLLRHPAPLVDLALQACHKRQTRAALV
jgi:hypothetical protein